MKKSWISRRELEEIVHFFDRELEEFANNEGLPIYDYNKQPIEWLDKNDFKTMFSDLSDSDAEALKSSQQDINKSRLKHCFFKVKELEKFLKDKYPEQYEIYNKNSQWIESREKEKRISSEDKLITGQEILKRWNAPEFNLLQAFERGLCAFDRMTGGMLYTQIVSYFDEDPNNPGVVVFEVVHDKRGEPTSSFYSGHEDSWIRTLLDDTKIIFKLSHVEDYEQKYGVIPKLSLNDVHNNDLDIDTDSLDSKKKGELARELKEKGYQWRQIAMILLKKDMEMVEMGEKEFESITSKLLRWAKKAGYTPPPQSS